MAEPGTIYLKASSLTVQDEAGGTVKVSGSPSVNRDLSSEFNWWQLRPKRSVSVDLPRVPEGKNWCANPYHEGYTEQGHDDDGWRPVNEFTTYVDVRGKRRLHEHCNTCRNRHRRKMYALQREAEGKPVRGWRRREAV